MDWTEEKLRRDGAVYVRLFAVGLVIFWICMVVKAFFDGPELNDPATAARNEGEPEGVHNEVDGTHRAVVNPVLELRRTVGHVINDLQQTINTAAAAADAEESTPAAAADRRLTQQIIDVFTIQLWAEADHFADDDDEESEASAAAAAAAGVAAAAAVGSVLRPDENRSSSSEGGNRSRQSNRFSRKQARERATRNEERTTASSEDRFEDTEEEDGLDGGCSRSVAFETDESSSGIQDCTDAAAAADRDCVSHSPAEEDLDAHKAPDADDDVSTPVAEAVARSNRDHDNAVAASVDVNDDRRNKGSNFTGGSGKFGGKRMETSAPPPPLPPLPPPPPSSNPIIDHLNAKLLEQLTADIVQRMESQKASEERLREELEAMVKARRDSERCYSDVVEQMKRFGLAWEGIRPKEAIKGQEEKEDQVTDEQTPRTS